MQTVKRSTKIVKVNVPILCTLITYSTCTCTDDVIVVNVVSSKLVIIGVIMHLMYVGHPVDMF